MGIVLGVAGASARRPARLLACVLHSTGCSLGGLRCGTTRGCMQKQKKGKIAWKARKKSMDAPAGWRWLVVASTRPRLSRCSACSCCRGVGARQRFCCEAKGEGQWATVHARPALWAHHAGALAAALRNGQIVRRRTHRVQALWLWAHSGAEVEGRDLQHPQSLCRSGGRAGRRRCRRPAGSRMGNGNSAHKCLQAISGVLKCACSVACTDYAFWQAVAAQRMPGFGRRCRPPLLCRACPALELAQGCGLQTLKLSSAVATGCW